MRIAVIGLGQIGMGVCRLALQGGHEVHGYDVATPESATLPAGLVLADSPAAAARDSDCVLLAVFDGAQALEVLRAILADAAGSQVVAVLSTVTLETMREADRLVSGTGVRVLDCGVSAGTAFQEGAKLALAVGGEQAACERVRPVLESFGDPVVYMGGLGSGMAAKLARNLMHYCSGLADWESASLAARAGVDVNSFVEFIKAAELKGKGHMRYVRATADGGLEDDGLPPNSYARKDLRAALDLATELELDLPAATLAAGIFDGLAEG
ncbi:NAD(P)-dependent oxidoreductase [Jatrophihabitans sp.]|uniref:NAD(P)-dependent oxidoreductase n=1 Tax=Jatrophihabitans sp. TaxID=1932789 RepID=UPI0030C67AE7|nr:beta-hydroxyacid dehydrogenase, 3-hydroxyisobutyrate dehydrogenase [Jatrophihabitans sp.]